MNDAIDALKRDLIKMMADVIRAEDPVVAADILRLVSLHITSALDELEARPC